MFDPRSIVLYRPPLVISRFDGTDTSDRPPLSVRLNPLRYSITLFPGQKRWTINEREWLFFAFANLTWRLWRRRLYDRGLERAAKVKSGLTNSAQREPR